MPWWVKVEASREKESMGVTMRPFSVQVPARGLALVFSSTHIRIFQTSFAGAEAK
ncbi:hypothetical protein GCM10017744_007940 [Streptomyces antimycoticus]